MTAVPIRALRGRLVTLAEVRAQLQIIYFGAARRVIALSALKYSARNSELLKIESREVPGFFLEYLAATSANTVSDFSSLAFSNGGLREWKFSLKCRSLVSFMLNFRIS